MALFPHLLTLEVFSHGFRVSKFNDQTRRILVEYCRRFIQYGMVPTGRGRYESRPVKVFAAATKARDEYFFHRHALDDFYQHLKYHGIFEDRIKRIDYEMYQPAHETFGWTDETRQPRDEQLAIVDFFMQPEPHSKVLTLQTGKGKTFTTCVTMRRKETRTVLLIKPMYMDQWIKETVETFGFKKGDIYSVNGSKALKDLIQLALNDEDATFDPKLIVISNATFRNFIRSYLDDPTADLYGIKPWEFLQVMGAGLRVIDEVHQDFHLNFIADTMTHVPETISLSATLVSDDRFTNDMYNLVWPPQCHAPTPKHDRYISLYSVLYRFNEPGRIKYMNLMKQYSQTTFEKSIMKQPKVLKAYIEMLVDLSWHHWRNHPDYRPGLKLAVYCGLVEMVEVVAEAMRKKYPDKLVRRFIDVDPDSHLEDGDIIVTTLQSCGTAKDIKRLGVVLSSIALSGKQANEQLIGRLRKPVASWGLPDWETITPRFIFLTNRDNEKHLKYHKEKREKLGEKVKDLSALPSSYIL